MLALNFYWHILELRFKRKSFTKLFINILHTKMSKPAPLVHVHNMRRDDNESSQHEFNSLLAKDSAKYLFHPIEKKKKLSKAFFDMLFSITLFSLFTFFFIQNMKNF